MRTNNNRFSSGSLKIGAVAGLSMMVMSVGMFVGCSEPVGHTKTVEKSTVDTPNGKTTTTETHEKDTKVIPPR